MTRPAAVVVGGVGISVSGAFELDALVPPNAGRRSEVGVTALALVGDEASGEADIGGEENMAAAASAREVRLAGVKRRRWPRGDRCPMSSSSIFFALCDMCWDLAQFLFWYNLESATNTNGLGKTEIRKRLMRIENKLRAIV